MGLFSSIGDFVKDSFGGIVGAAGKVVGGLIGADSQKDVNAANTNFAREQLQFQKDYIKNRLKWQVQDAKKAGLHPMVAAGISPTSFSPVSLGNSPIDSDWIGEAGQNIAYASAKAKDRKQQQEAWNFTKEMNEAQIDGVRLDNELKVMQIMSQLALLNQTGPSAPSLNGKSTLIEGQNDSPIKYVPDEVIRSGPSPSTTAGTHPLWTHARSGDFTIPVLSDKVADAVTENKEKNIGAEISYALSAWNGSVRPPMNSFTAKEKQLLASGEYEAYYYPLLGWRVEPRLSWKNFKKFVLGGYRSR